MLKNKKVKYRIISFILVCAMLLSLLPQNMIFVRAEGEDETVTEFVTNGDFETNPENAYLNVNKTGVTSQVSPLGNTGWHFYTTAETNMICEIVEGGRGGSGHALKVSRPEGATDKIPGTILRNNDAKYEFEQGATYRVSIWFKPVDVNNGAEAYLTLREKTESTTLNTTTPKANNRDDNNVWVEKTFEFKATENKYHIELKVGSLQTGYFLIDDVSITKIKDAEDPTITVTAEAVALAVGENYQLAATITPNGAVEEIAWSSDNTSIATVDENGLVTAIGEGTASITAAINWNSKTIAASCTVTVSAGVIAPEAIVLPRTQETVFVDETIQLMPKASNADATEGGWTFTSSDSSVATVDENGIVTGVSKGQCTITISNKYNTELEATCNLQVWKNALKNGGFETGKVGSWVLSNQNAITAETMKYEFDSSVDNVYSGNRSLKLYTTGDTLVKMDVCWNNLPLNPGANYKLMAKVKAENLTAGAPQILYKIYHSDENNKTIVSGGEVLETIESANTNGWVDVEANFNVPENAVKSSMQIWFAEGTGTVWYDQVAVIEWIPVETVTLDASALYLETGKEATLQATTAPAEASDHSLLFESSNSNVATVDANGKITAVGCGEAVITVTAISGGCKATCAVAVIDKYIDLTDISIKETLTLCAGTQEKLVVEYTPEDATNKDIIWKSNDETVAFVDANGVVTALKEGRATVTAEAAGGISKSCTVTVEKSATLLTEKAELTTDYGKSISGDLSGYVTNNTGSNEVTYKIWETPQNGTLELKADGSYTYLPLSYGAAQADKAVIIVTAGTNTALLEIEITIKQVADSLLQNLNENITMLVTRNQLEVIREEIKDETSVRYSIWNSYKSFAEGLKGSTPPKYEDYSDDENHYAMWMRGVGDQTAHLLWAYLFTGDEAYKETCIDYAVTSASYPKWATWDYYQEADLAAGHQAYAIAMVYNWLYDDLTQEQRDIIAKKLYYACGQFQKKWGDSNNYLQNHLHICVTALCSTAISLYIHAEDVAEANGVDVETVKQTCADGIQIVCDKVGLAFDALPKDGAGHEGPGYYTYAVEWLLKSALLLNSNLNIDMFTGNEWLQNSSTFYSNIMHPKNSITSGNSHIDYSSSKRSPWYGPSHVFRVLAGIYKDEKAQWIAETYESKKAGTADSNYWLGVLFADPNVEAKISEEESTLYHADELGIVVSRQNWSGDESLLYIRNGLPLGRTPLEVLGLETIKAGTNESHCDPDLNAVILMAEGEYLLKGDGISYKKTAYNSTLLIDDTGQLGEGGPGLNAEETYDLYVQYGYEPGYVVLDEQDTYNYIVGDATVAYRPSLGLKKFQRNIVFLKEENVMLVVDDIETLQNKNLELRWFPESVTVSEEYGIYTTYGNKYNMKFYPFTENVSTEFASVDVLNNDETKRTEKVFRQTVNGNDWQNAVAFTWGEAGKQQASVRYLKGEGDIHQFEVNDNIYTINVSDNTVTISEGNLELEENEWAGDSTLSAILFNGNALEGFERNSFEYNVEKSWKVKTLEIIPVTSGPNATAKVTWDGNCPGTATIECTSENGKSTSVYTLNLKNDEGLLDIEAVELERNASTIDPSCMYDSYIQEKGSDRTWASTGLPIVTYDLGQLADIRKIDIAFNYSSRRIFYYDMMISENGTDWTWITDKDGYGESTLTTTGSRSDYCNIFEADEAIRARYVRFNLRCHNESGLDNAGGVCSIQEISFYGQIVNNEDTGDSGSAEEGGNTGDSGSAEEGGNTGDSGSTEEGGNTGDSGSTEEGDETDDGSDETDDGSDEQDSSSEQENTNNQNQDTQINSPNTGDYSISIGWWIVIAIVAAGLSIFLFRRKED